MLRALPLRALPLPAGSQLATSPLPAHTTAHSCIGNPQSCSLRPPAMCSSAIQRCTKPVEGTLTAMGFCLKEQIPFGMKRREHNCSEGNQCPHRRLCNGTGKRQDGEVARQNVWWKADSCLQLQARLSAMQAWLLLPYSKLVKLGRRPRFQGPADSTLTYLQVLLAKLTRRQGLHGATSTDRPQQRLRSVRLAGGERQT